MCSNFGNCGCARDVYESAHSTYKCFEKREKSSIFCYHFCRPSSVFDTYFNLQLPYVEILPCRRAVEPDKEKLDACQQIEKMFVLALILVAAVRCEIHM